MSSTKRLDRNVDRRNFLKCAVAATGGVGLLILGDHGTAFGFPARGYLPTVELTWYDGDKHPPLQKQHNMPDWHEANRFTRRNYRKGWTIKKGTRT